MARPSKDARIRALTASAIKLTGRAADGPYMRRMSQPWQLRALSYYDAIGEIRFASQFYAKLLSRCRFYPARQLPDGRTEAIESGPAVDLMDRIQDPGGGRSRLQYDYGRMMFVTGEGVLFATERDGVDEWRFLWKDEVKYDDLYGRWQRVRFDKQPYSPPEYGTAYRLWTPHIRHSDEADSPLLSVMDICEELLILTASVRATAVSRMINGIFKIPQEMDFSAMQPGMDEDPIGGTSFLQDYVEHTESQIDNPGSAAGRAPFAVIAPYEYLDRFGWEKTHDSATDYMERELRKEAIERLAIGLDFPPEFLLGMTDANHWTARQVVYDMWRSYGTPVAERLGDDLSDSYLRPALREEGHEWENVVVTYDDSQVVIPPDMTEIANAGLDRLAIGRKGWRVLSGISEEHAPDEEEEELLASLKLRQPIELDDGNLVIPQRGPVAQANGSSPEDGPPVPSGGREGSRQEARTASARIHGAAELALIRCRELAGMRIRHKCPDCAEGEPNPIVASIVGEAFVRDPLKLVQGGTDGLRFWLSQEGWDDAQSTALCQQLEVFAARTLFQPSCPELPSGFVAAIERGKEASSALVTTES